MNNGSDDDDTHSDTSTVPGVPQRPPRPPPVPESPDETSDPLRASARRTVDIIENAGGNSDDITRAIWASLPGTMLADCLLQVLGARQLNLPMITFYACALALQQAAPQWVTVPGQQQMLIAYPNGDTDQSRPRSVFYRVLAWAMLPANARWRGNVVEQVRSNTAVMQTFMRNVTLTPQQLHPTMIALSYVTQQNVHLYRGTVLWLVRPSPDFDAMVVRPIPVPQPIDLLTPAEEQAGGELLQAANHFRVTIESAQHDWWQQVLHGTERSAGEAWSAFNNEMRHWSEVRARIIDAEGRAAMRRGMLANRAAAQAAAAAAGDRRTREPEAQVEREGLDTEDDTSRESSEASSEGPPLFQGEEGPEVPEAAGKFKMARPKHLPNSATRVLPPVRTEWRILNRADRQRDAQGYPRGRQIPSAAPANPDDEDLPEEPYNSTDILPEYYGTHKLSANIVNAMKYYGVKHARDIPLNAWPNMDLERRCDNLAELRALQGARAAQS